MHHGEASENLCLQGASKSLRALDGSSRAACSRSRDGGDEMPSIRRPLTHAGRNRRDETQMKHARIRRHQAEICPIAADCDETYLENLRGISKEMSDQTKVWLKLISSAAA